MSSKEHEVIDLESWAPEIEFIGRAPVTIDLSEVDEVEPRGSIVAKPNKRPILASRKDVPLAKRRATDAAVAERALNVGQKLPVAGPSGSPGSRKKRKQDQNACNPVHNVITLQDLDDDSEAIELLEHPPKRSRPKSLADSDSEDYDTIHAGFDLTRSSNWDQQIPVPDEHADDAIIHSMDGLSLVPVFHPPKRIGHYSSHFNDDPLDLSRDTDARPPLWVTLRKMSIPRPPKTHKLRNGLYTSLNYDTLRLKTKIRTPSGSINRITQNSFAIVACSATFQGYPDEDGSEEDPGAHNTEGSLQILHEGRVHAIDAHSRQRSSYKKYYTINDVKFDPHCPSRFVSSGNDRTLRLWNCEKLNLQAESSPSDVQLESTLTYHEVPHDLHYKPDSSVLAVACKDGNIYIYPTAESIKKDCGFSFSVAPAESEQSTGSVVWGLRATSHILFASSEPWADDSFCGFHRAFDVNKQKVLYDFSADEGGDCMAVDGDGDRLALFTTSSSSHILRLYDIRRANGQRPQHTIELNPFKSGPGEITSASFSPDGIYLAVGRNDNAIHIYDCRMPAEACHSFRHPEPNGNNGSGTYGIVDTKWVQTPNRRKLGLVTGGHDGCVRLWDVQRASDLTNGRVIAEADFGIGDFALGDPFSGEKPLIMGDCGGGIYIYDGMGSIL